MKVPVDIKIVAVKKIAPSHRLEVKEDYVTGLAMSVMIESFTR